MVAGNAAVSKVALQIDIPASAWHPELLRHLHGFTRRTPLVSWITFEDVDAVTFTKRPVDSIQVLHATATVLRQKVAVMGAKGGAGVAVQSEPSQYPSLHSSDHTRTGNIELYLGSQKKGHMTRQLSILRIWLEEKEFNVQVISTARVPILVASASGLRLLRL